MFRCLYGGGFCSRYCSFFVFLTGAQIAANPPPIPPQLADTAGMARAAKRGRRAERSHPPSGKAGACKAARAARAAASNTHVPVSADVTRWPTGLLTMKPQVGETFMLLKPKFQDLIFEGSKTLENRHQRFSPGLWFVGHSKVISGLVVLGDAFEVASDSDWRALVAEHCVDHPTRMYATTWAHPVTQARRIKPVAYKHHVGAIGRMNFEPASAPPVRRRWRTGTLSHGEVNIP